MGEKYVGIKYHRNLFGVIELLGKFDPVIQDHLRKIENNDLYDHYLVREIMINKIVEASL